jgi:hypothetical protein
VSAHPPPAARPSRPVWPWLLAILFLAFVGAALNPGLLGLVGEPTASPAPSPGGPSAEPTAAPSVGPAGGSEASHASAPKPAGAPAASDGGTVPGRLAIDFEHPLRSGTLRIWLDDELVVDQKLAGQAAKKLVFSVRKGSYKDELEIVPGRHVVKVQVRWEDTERTERVATRFKPGATRRLQVRLGRLRKNLSLEWQ